MALHDIRGRWGGEDGPLKKGVEGPK